MQQALVALTQTSLRKPREAAQLIMAMELNRDVLWSALALVAIINTFLIVVVLQISPPTFPMPGYLERPLTLFILIAGLMVVYIHAMYWSGLAIGGKGLLMDVLAVVVWFQILRAMAQMLLIVVSLAIPGAGALLSLVVAVWGLWIFLNFIAASLNLSTVWHAIAVLVVAFVGLVLGMGTLVALLGGVAQGVLS